MAGSVRFEAHKTVATIGSDGTAGELCKYAPLAERQRVKLAPTIIAQCDTHCNSGRFDENLGTNKT